ncbi:phosphatidylinositol glycan anchor biosynthesis class U protein-like [Gigantopelta aegis]|uniref:phosphatidylinositol glycan anchor biosynthesis class U protein-like n=1 Tax=Gigantopelta aegis TaxID=1735272 RepID=UPI001B889CA3|nr:phosphatidylinositol glycan anchor biosynthesis class U protein-like [Gigantopelta aegis]
MSGKLFICFLLGIGLRLSLFKTSLPSWLESKNEVVTPLTSWERVEEGLALQENLISAYAGNNFHESPLLLRILGVFSRWPGGVNLLFVLVDAVVGFVLMKIAKEFGLYLLQKQKQEVKKYATNVTKMLHRSKDLRWLQVYVVVMHFFNPYSIATCLAKSTALFSNLAVLLCFLFTLKGNELLSTLFIAVASYQCLYPFVLTAPVAIYFYRKACPNTDNYSDMKAAGSYIRTSGLVIFWTCLLLGLSFLMEGSWNFLHSTYGFILTVPDLTPNIGVFWYFFTEMFEHFRTFFLCVFQINAVIFTVPLAITLKDSPVFQMYILVFLMGIFKSYPSYADAALYFSLLPLWRHIFQYMRNKFVVGCMYICCSVFAPILWHLWIYAGSANANFYFAITLTYSTSEVFLVTDLLFAFLRRQFDLTNGVDKKLKNGEPAQIILQ